MPDALSVLSAGSRTNATIKNSAAPGKLKPDTLARDPGKSVDPTGNAVANAKSIPTNRVGKPETEGTATRSSATGQGTQLAVDTGFATVYTEFEARESVKGSNSQTIDKSTQFEEVKDLNPDLILPMTAATTDSGRVFSEFGNNFSSLQASEAPLDTAMPENSLSAGSSTAPDENAVNLSEQTALSEPTALSAQAALNEQTAASAQTALSPQTALSSQTALSPQSALSPQTVLSNPVPDLDSQFQSVQSSPMATHELMQEAEVQVNDRGRLLPDSGNDLPTFLLNTEVNAGADIAALSQINDFAIQLVPARTNGDLAQANRPGPETPFDELSGDDMQTLPLNTDKRETAITRFVQFASDQAAAVNQQNLQLSPAPGQAAGSAVIESQLLAASSGDTLEMDTATFNQSRLETAASFTPGENKVARLQLELPFSKTGWSNELGEKIGLMFNKQIEQATIQLDPPELGPLQVRINVQHDQVSVQFHSNSSMVRDALEQTGHRLQQLFEQEGLELVNVDVSGEREQSQRKSSAETNAEAGNDADSEQATDDGILTQMQIARRDNGNIDYFI